MKPSRRRKGATLGLVAACVLVIIILGVAVFFLAKLFGGGREVANATDAGTLNLAKNALISPSVTLPANSEFAGCSYNITTKAPDGTIDLFTYNRCVGQALLVAMNAKAETDAGASGAMAHAQSVLTDLNTLGTQLTTALNNNAGLQQRFTAGANKNNVHMFGDASTVNGPATYQTAFMKAGGATNVYLGTQVIPYDGSSNYPSQNNSNIAYKLGASATSSPDPVQPPRFPNLSNKFYLEGYNGISVSAGGTTLTFYGVPVFPNQKPHLVSLNDFKASQTAPDPTTPPNSFRIDSSAQEVVKTNNFGGAVACAIVGSVMQGSGASAISPDFPVAIPTGYIEFVNPAGNTLPAGYLPTDESNNIFNNELYDGPGGGLPTGGAYGAGGSGLYTANGGADGGGVFGDLATIQAWATYNAGYTPTGAPDPYNPSHASGGNPGNVSGMYYKASAYPPTMGFPVPPTTSGPPGTAAHIYNDAGLEATFADCIAISTPPAPDNCTWDNSFGAGLSGKCLTFLNGDQFYTAYGHPMPVASGSPPGGVSAVDTIKGAIIANFNGAGYHKQITVTAGNGAANTTNNTVGASPAFDCNNAAISSTVPSPSPLKASTGLGEYMGTNGLLDVYATPNPSNQDKNVFPIQNTGQSVPSGAHPSILGLLSQLDTNNGPAMSSSTNYSGMNFSNCSLVYQSLLQRVQQIQPNITDVDLKGLLNGPLESASGTQYGLQMGQTAFIYLKNADLNDASGVKGLHIYACTTGTTPTALPFYSGQNPDGVPGSNNVSSAGAASCQQQYSLYRGGAGLIDVSIGGNQTLVYGEPGSNPKGDDSLHDQPYMSGPQPTGSGTTPDGDFQATDTGKWTPSSGYGNLLGRLNFSDVVSGSANFSSPN